MWGRIVRLGWGSIGCWGKAGWEVVVRGVGTWCGARSLVCYYVQKRWAVVASIAVGELAGGDARKGGNRGFCQW